MIDRRTFVRVLASAAASLAALPHLASRAFGYRQRFVPVLEDQYGNPIDETYPVEFVDVYLTRNGTLNSLVQVAVENRWGVELPGRSDLIDARLILQTGQYVRFIFRSKQPTLRSNQTYWLAVHKRG